MYYCILCEEIHTLKYSECETVFSSGFHYYNRSLYSAGICRCELCNQEKDHKLKSKVG